MSNQNPLQQTNQTKPATSAAKESEAEINRYLQEVQIAMNRSFRLAVGTAVVGTIFQGIFAFSYIYGVPFRFSLLVGLGIYGISVHSLNTFAKQSERVHDLLTAKTMWILSDGKDEVQKEIVRCLLGAPESKPVIAITQPSSINP